MNSYSIFITIYVYYNAEMWAAVYLKIQKLSFSTNLNKKYSDLLSDPS